MVGGGFINILNCTKMELRVSMGRFSHTRAVLVKIRQLESERFAITIADLSPEADSTVGGFQDWGQMGDYGDSY